MAVSKTIFTIDARDNVMLEALCDRYDMTPLQVHQMISNDFVAFQGILETKGIKYADLKTALIPNLDRNEMVMVFDTQQIATSWYGKEVFDQIIPLLDKSSSHSVLCGDYIDHYEYRHYLYDAFAESLVQNKQYQYNHPTQFYLVYLNNLSDKMKITLNEGLKRYAGYIGYFDLNFSSYLKGVLSTMLVKSFVKHKSFIIQGHEDDMDNKEDYNMLGYPFENHGYTCRSLQSVYVDLFLSYKIERAVQDGEQTDALLGLNAMVEDVTEIKDFSLLIEDAKFNYLLDKKAASLKKAGILNLKKEELEELIKSKMQSNYIYNLSYSNEFDVVKFNIMLEIMSLDTDIPCKLVASLEYMHSSKILRVITIY